MLHCIAIVRNTTTASYPTSDAALGSYFEVKMEVIAEYCNFRDAKKA
jgi:hypothetical protein